MAAVSAPFTSTPSTVALGSIRFLAITSPNACVAPFVAASFPAILGPMGIDIRLFGAAEESMAPLERLRAIAQFISDDPRVRLAGAIAADENSSPHHEEEDAGDAASGTDDVAPADLGSDNEDADDTSPPGISVPLFPCCDPVTMMAGEEGVYVEARTSHAGPGYHEHLCELLDRLAKEFNLTWEVPRNEEGDIDDGDTGDETSYFWDRDRGQLERAMLSWLRSTCKSVLQSLTETGEDTTIGICMPIDAAFTTRGLVHTPLGPRDKAWLKAVANGVNDGRDFFPWWERGTTPLVKLQRAKVCMWSEVRWRQPQSELEDIMQHEVHALLEEAYREEPSLAIPCREWQELLSFGALTDISPVLKLEVEHNAAQEAKKGNLPLIGYRRNDVRRTVAGFSFLIPGSMGEEIEDGQTWVAFDTGRTMRMSNFTVEGKDGGEPPSADELIEGGPPIEGETQLVPHTRTKTLSRRGAIQQVTEEDSSYTNLTGIVTGQGSVALVTLSFDDPQDQTWAIEVWKTIVPPGVKDES